jgi:hypothetical protein
MAVAFFSGGTSSIVFRHKAGKCEPARFAGLFLKRNDDGFRIGQGYEQAVKNHRRKADWYPKDGAARCARFRIREMRGKNGRDHIYYRRGADHFRRRTDIRQYL